MYKFIILILSIFLFSSCSKETSNKNEQTQKTDTVKVKTNADETHLQKDHPVETSLKLNNGKKWKSDQSTEKYVKELNRSVEDFEKSKSNDYKSLGEKQMVIIDNLIKECKMKGADHDALHQWLEPVITDVNELKNGSKDSKLKYDELKKQLSMFNDYFEL